MTVAIPLLAVTVCCALLAAPLPASDEFGDGTEHAISVEGGALVLEPRVRTLSGILVRNPTSTHERENWISLRTGVLPKTLQVGMDAFTGLDAPHGDLVSHVDWFRFAPTGVPPKSRNAPATKLLPYLTR